MMIEAPSFDSQSILLFEVVRPMVKPLATVAPVRIG